MKIIDYIFTWKNKKRAEITEEASGDRAIKNIETKNKACRFADALMGEMGWISRIDELLSAPLVAHNKDRHLKLTLPELDWLNYGMPLTILFCLETSEPICAYFEEAKS